jgi:putative heme-binding domain-containing protein
MSRPHWLAAAWLAASVALPVFVYAGQDASAADIAGGQAIFGGACVVCHGIDGGGAMGPPLNRPKLQAAPDDEALRRVIVDGIPERGMPRVRRWTDNELRQLVAYVRSLSRSAVRAPVTGNVRAGAAVYEKMGCATCHLVGGQGGSFGPQLTDIGFARGADYLRQALIDPAAALPKSALLGIRGYEEYLPVEIVTRDARTILGVRVNEDAFTIQVREQSGALHSFRKSEVRSIRKEFGASYMPSYKELRSADLDDLIAYLASLGGEP